MSTIPKPRQTTEIQQIVMVWNFMDGKIDWPALELAVELFDIADPERLIFGLIAIREHQRRIAEAEAEMRNRRR